MLDSRLQSCFDLVGGEGIVCDVGTDHALLAAELISSGKCSRVIASDIKEGPLEAASRTVEKYGVAGQVSLVLSNGLESVPLDGVSDVVIAGMGGETIADIVGRALEGDVSCENIRWILQPMTKPEHLRKMMYELGLQITEERAIADGDKLYVVMCAEQSVECRRLTEFETLYGFFADDDEMGKKYRERESARLEKVAEALGSAGKSGDAAHFRALSYKLANGSDLVPVEAICSLFNDVYPFDTQEKWDNSGLLVNAGLDCCKVLITLDIDRRAVDEAELKAADLVVSHHPVIFDPIRSISSEMPVYRLVQNDISALCMHTNVDKAERGTNGVILRELSRRFGFDGEPGYINDEQCGYICTLRESVPAEEFAAVLKEIFGCEYIRVSAGAREVRKIGFCSGSGGSFLADITAAGCDAYVTGDVKHDVWMEAENSGVKLFDCGHFHTENPVIWELRRVLEEKYPQLDVEIAESSTDPCVYF